MAEDLKPCPKCGGKGKLKTLVYYRVTCSINECKFTTVSHDMQWEAIQDWNSMTPDLKSCPFCGNDAVLHKDEKGFAIGCSNDSCVIGKTRYYSMPEQAVEAWNRRTN